MKTHEEIYNILKEKFPEAVLELQANLNEPIVAVSPEAIQQVCMYLRDTDGLLFDSLMLLTGVDDANGEKVNDADGGFAINGGTLSVYYHLYSFKLGHKITLRASAPRETPEVESVTSVWMCADWHEREAYDMVGIKFLHHPDLRRILMPYDWQDGSHPLRKDYKNPEFYMGMKIS
ncbi:MAG: NADH-quinone oxidoreductase subunit C [Bacteroidota bacterium]